MKSLKEKKMFVVMAFLAIVVFIGASYAFITFTLTGTKTYSIVGGELKLELDESENELTIGDTEAIPVNDYQGLQQDGYNFTIRNSGGGDVDYYVYVEDTEEKTMPDVAVRYGLRLKNLTEVTTGEFSELENRLLVSGTIPRRQSISYNLKFWIGESATNEQVIGKVFSVRLKIVGEQVPSFVYRDSSGASAPVIEGDLIPVTIDDAGVVRKANIYESWYDYDNSIWANAVIVNDEVKVEYGNSKATTIIPEEAIEAYFVWIPRYRYKIFDEGKYTALGSKEQAEQPIEIEFETNDVEKSTGSTYGTWLTHPAFTTFDDINGFWVAKFESGYKGATTTATAQVNSGDSKNLVIKPNQYSWRNITVGNAFKVSYDYQRELESHMMKNTEWGAVAYLSHSFYGAKTKTDEGWDIGQSLRVNNNTNYVTGYAATEEPTKGYSASSIAGNRQEAVTPGNDGTYTVNYYNTTSVVASTTGNVSGVYDMSGGAWENVMGNTNNTVGSSGITSVVSDFYTNAAWAKYYDKYANQTSYTVFNNRILGDATGEMGPFFSETDPDGNTRNKSSWYGDYADFAYSSNPWFRRGGDCSHGAVSGAFAFNSRTGGVYTSHSFRVVLAP